MTDIKEVGDKITKLTFQEVRELQVYLSQTYGIYMEFETETGLEYEKIKASKGKPLVVGNKMSGHTEFTWWIKREASYAIHNGVKKDIKDVYFTSNDEHNDDDLIIEFTDGDGSKNFQDIDYVDLSLRFIEREQLKRR